MASDQDTEKRDLWRREEPGEAERCSEGERSIDSGSIEDSVRSTDELWPEKLQDDGKSSRNPAGTPTISGGSAHALLSQSSDAFIDNEGNGAKGVDDEVRSIIDHIRDTSLRLEEDGTVSERDKVNESQLSKTSPVDQISHFKSSKFESERDTAAHADDSAHTDKSPPQSVSQNALAQIEPTGQSGQTSTRATSLNPEIHRNSLPPEPEPEIRFNFHLFLEQLRHRTADPVARYLRSFLVEFGKKQWSVQEQVRIISDFLNFIGGKMAQCEVWRDSNEAEFDNAGEGMEKLVMNRLYTQTFSPELPPPVPSISDSRGRRRSPKPILSGRRGQHQEDVERDTVLREKMQIFGWVEEQHLDIKPVSAEGKRFLSLAQDELLKINNYRAPRDKVICILNACKVIFGLLRSSSNTDTSADSFMPLLIYVVLRARPQHLVSNLQYIFRFRNQSKLGGEAGYYLSSLMGAVQFVENLDKTALTVSDEDFERQVEASVAAIAERQSEITPPNDDTLVSLLEPKSKSKKPLSRSTSRPGAGDSEGPVQGILKNIQRPLTNLGRIFSDETNDTENTDNSAASVANYGDAGTSIQRNSPPTPIHREVSRSRPSRGLPPDVDVDNIVETLSSMFPSLDKDIISDIVIAKQARIGAAVDACLNLTSQS